MISPIANGDSLSFQNKKPVLCQYSYCLHVFFKDAVFMRHYQSFQQENVDHVSMFRLAEMGVCLLVCAPRCLPAPLMLCECMHGYIPLCECVIVRMHA